MEVRHTDRRGRADARTHQAALTIPAQDHPNSQLMAPLC
jgi:hypothetical protein